MAEKFERMKVTLDNNYSELKNRSNESYQQTNANSDENKRNNPFEETLSFVNETVTNARENINQILDKLGITLNEFREAIFSHDKLDFNDRLPKLSEDETCFVLDNGMQILAAEVDDISTDKMGYTISLYPNQTSQVFLPDGLYIDSSLVEDIRVEKNTTTVHLTGDGYLVYDKTNRIVKRKNPVYHGSTQKNPVFQKIDDYIKSVFFSWDEVLHPIITQTVQGEEGASWNYFSQKTTETVWGDEGISLLNFNGYGGETIGKDGNRENIFFYPLNFNNSITIYDDNFLAYGAFEAPKDSISDICFHEDSYDINFKNYIGHETLTLNNSSNVNFDISSLSHITMYNDSMVVHFKDGRTLTYELYGDFMNREGNWKKEQKGGIFSEFNSYVKYYGGNQEYFSPHIDELLEDEWITKFLKEKYPDADELDYYLFYEQLDKCGCGYISLANCIFDQFEGQEDLFKKYFGYDMYTVDSSGVKKYNYKYLTTELFSYYWSDHDIREIGDYLEKTDPNLNLTVENYSDKKYDVNLVLDGFTPGTGELTTFVGSNPIPRTECLKNFLEEKIPAEDYQFNDDTLYYYDEIEMTERPSMDINKIQKCLNNGETVELSSWGYDLYTINPVTGERGDCYLENGESHAMTITDVTSKGDLIVSTWGQKLIVDVSNADDFSVVSRDITLEKEKPNILESAIEWVKDEAGLS